MWLRATRGGSIFKKVIGIHGLYYNNPKGLSTSAEFKDDRYAEEKQIFFEYSDVFGQDNFNEFEEYFNK